MLTKNNGISGGSVVVSPSSILAGFDDVLRSTPTGTACSTFPNNNNLDIMDVHQVGGTSNGDSILTFSPLNDVELRRRTRNNAILAKIQELEANASLQAARSERLRMMKEEYESLVRKYSSNRHWNWGPGSSRSGGLLNDNSTYHHASYLHQTRVSGSHFQQQPFTSSAAGAQESFGPQPHSATRDISTNLNKSFISTIGVNTDISGPVHSAYSHVEAGGGSQEFPKMERKKVKVIIDGASQTESGQMLEMAGGYSQVDSASTAAAEHPSKPQVSPSIPFIYGESPNQKAIVMMSKENEREVLSVLQQQQQQQQQQKRSKLPVNVEMMMMLEDEDDESLLEAQERRKLQLQHFHHQLEQQPRAPLHVDDNTSIISSAASSPAGEIGSNSNTTSENPVVKLHSKQKQQRQRKQPQPQKKESAGEVEKRKSHKMSINFSKKEEDEETTTTISYPYGHGDGDHKKKSRAAMLYELSDLSASDSISVFQKHQTQRKTLLQQLATSTSNISGKLNKNKPKSDDISLDETHGGDLQDTLSERISEDEEDTEKSVIKGRSHATFNKDSERNRKVDRDEDEFLQCSSPTAGATSESLGDSLMDSIQKTPDTLPRDDSELLKIAEVNEEEQEEIELAHKVSSAIYAGVVDEAFLVAATAAHSKPSGGGTHTILMQSGVNDMLSGGKKGKQSGFKGDTEGHIKELVGHHEQQQINDAEEIRPNNLSSSKLETPAQVENFLYANNPDESTAPFIATTSTPPALHAQHMKTVEDRVREGENSQDLFYRDEGPQKEEKELFLDENNGGECHDNSQLEEGKQMVVDGGEGNESDKKRGTTAHSSASSANVPAHSSNNFRASSGFSGMDGGKMKTQLNMFSAPQSSSTTSSSSSSRVQSLDDARVGASNTTTMMTTHENELTTQAPEQPGKGERNWNEMELGVIPQRKSSIPTVIVPTVTRPTGNNDGSNNNLSKNGNNNGAKGNEEKMVTSGKSGISAAQSRGNDTAVHTDNPGGSRSPGDSKDSTNFRTRRPLRNSSPMKPVLGGTAITVPTGPPGARYTQRRVRLKLNYDDSESDSSEIGPIKALQPSSSQAGNNMTVEKGRIGQQQQQQQKTNEGSGSTDLVSQNESETLDVGKSSKKEEDDFDDFFDM